MCTFFACIVVMAAATGKRKRVVWSLENKIVILDGLAKVERATKLATKFGIGNATITDLKKNKDKIRSFVALMKNLSVPRTIMRLAENEKVDEALYLWYTQKRSQGIPVTGPILWEKAGMFHHQLHFKQPSSSFYASTGWQW